MGQEDRCEFLLRDAQTASKCNLFCRNPAFMDDCPRCVFTSDQNGFLSFDALFLLSASQCRCKCANTFCARLPSSAREHNSGKRESSTVAAVNSAERNERKKTNHITVSPLVTLALLHVF